MKKILEWKLKFLAGLMLIVSGFVSVYHLAYYEKIYPRVKVAGVDVSNLNIAEAERVLVSRIESAPKKISLKFSQNSYEINLDEIEVVYRPKKTAESAFLLGRGSGVWKDLVVKWRGWFLETKLGFEIDFNKKEVERIIDEVSLAVDEDPIMPLLSLDGDQVLLTPGRNGRLVEREKLFSLLEKEIKEMGNKEVLIPVSLFQVGAGEQKLDKVLELADLLKEKSLKLEYDDYAFKVEGEKLLSLIGFDGEWSKSEISKVIEEVAEELNREPQNAVFQFNGLKVVEFKPALDGFEVNVKKASEDVFIGLEGLTQETKEIEIELMINRTAPRVKINEVNDLGIKELIGIGRSSFYHSIPSREHNVNLTANIINGTLVPPGEVFSFNKSVGDISASTGFLAAYIIKDGRTVLGDGGGVCQDSTTVFRAALDAGLEIVERHAHAYRVSYYEQNSPPGIDATVYSPSTDLKFRNDTNSYILIQTKVDLTNKQMRVEIYGTSDGRRAEITNTRIWGQSPPPEPLYQDDPSLPTGTLKQIDWAASGAKAAFDWKVVRGNEVVHKKTFYSSYRPWQAVYLRGAK